MDLTQAIQKHAEWKLKLRSAIANKEKMDVATISKDNCCELGKWLYGDGTAKFGAMASYATCVRKHAAFHVEAGKVARAINDGQYTAAESMLGAGTPYTAASSAVGVAIMALKKESGL
ncbi:MAG TPA: CZB domain-containing protein [Rhodocyclaceae bacterium]|nr:CZB domain-containing protein [Rhodocyclaceae bacterium]